MEKNLTLEIEYLLSQSTNDLYQSMAELTEPEMNLFGSSKSELIQKGKSYFQSLNSDLKQTICLNDNIRKLLLSENRSQEKLTIALVITDCLMSKFSTYPITTISVLIAQEGLYYYCKDCLK